MANPGPAAARICGPANLVFALFPAPPAHESQQVGPEISHRGKRGDDEKMNDRRAFHAAEIDEGKVYKNADPEAQEDAERDNLSIRFICHRTPYARPRSGKARSEPLAL